MLKLDIEPDRIYTKREVTSMLCVSTGTVANWMRKGMIKYTGEGRNARFVGRDISAIFVPFNQAITHLRAGNQARLGLAMTLDISDCQASLRLGEFHNLSCIYFLCDEDRAVLYVGQTTNLLGRLQDHLNHGKAFNAVAYLPVPKDELDKREVFFIDKYQPPLNKHRRAGELL